MGRWRILAFAVAPLVVAALIAISIGVILELPGDYRLIALAVFPVLLLGGRAAIIDFVSTRMQREWLARGVPAEITLTYTVLPEGLQLVNEVATPPPHS